MQEVSMSNKELQLFVYEGGSAEPKYVDKLEKNFLGERIAIKCVYDAEIYQLYRQLKDDDFAIDIVSILKERSPKNAEILKDYNRDSFAYIYLFFDYDGHSTMADDSKIKEMLQFFDNETENGMLYISYPMVEAIRHYKDMDSFQNSTAKCKRGKSLDAMKCPYKEECETLDECLQEPHYKPLSASDNNPQLNNINHYNEEVWKTLIKAHVFKMNYLVNDSYSMPQTIEAQSTIFENQYTKYINHKCPKVAVLSAFPIYVLDYYGVEGLTKSWICSNYYDINDNGQYSERAE